MINNCQKCGNPLQEGVTSCPICGTNINVAPAPAATQNAEVAPIAQTVSTVQQPVVAPVEVQTVQAPTVAPVEAQVVQAPTVEAPVVQPAQQVAAAVPTVAETVPVQQDPVSPAPLQTVVEQPVIAPVAPQVAPAQIVQPVPQTIQPAVQQVAQVAAVQPTLDPTAAPVLAQPTPIVAPASIAQSLEAIASQNPEQPKVEVPEQIETNNKGKAKKIDIKNLTKNQKIIAVAVVAVIIMTIVGISLSSSSLGKPVVPAQNQTPVSETAVAKELASNGYKLKLEEGWIVEEGGSAVIIKKDDDSVVINIKNSSGSIETINKETLTSYFSTQNNFSDVKVEETELSGKKTYIVNVNYSLNGTNVNYPVQYYYINGGTNLIIGSAIVYEDETAKTDNAAFITNLMGTMSYSDDTIKALDTINMYSEVFQKYVFSLRPPMIPSTPSAEVQPSEPQENES